MDVKRIMTNRLPNLIVLSQLLLPARTGIHELRAIHAQLINRAGARDSVLVKGLYVLGFTQVEIAFGDTLSYILNRNPGLLTFQKLEFDREALFNTALVQELLENQANRTVNKLARGRIEELFQKLLEYTQISLPNDALVNTLNEFRERRNLILHRAPMPATNGYPQKLFGKRKLRGSPQLQRQQQILMP